MITLTVVLATLAIYDYVRIYRILSRIEEEIEIIEKKIDDTKINMDDKLDKVKEKMRMLQ